MTMALRLWRSPWVQAGALVLVVAAALVVLWWRGPDWRAVGDAFRFVAWNWIVLAFLLNVISTLFRALSWSLTISQALPPRHHPRLVQVFSAFGVGLFANAIVPGRLGELARVATLRRHLPDAPPGTTATLVGTVFAHRLFDLVPATMLVTWVLLTAEVPHWAVVGLLIAAAVGLALFTVAWLGARRHHRPVVREGVGTVRHLLGMARVGLSVLKAPVPLAGAIVFQCMGWLLQLLAVFATMQAFGIDAALHAAGLVLVLMNVATIVPLWPGNVGLVQAAVALPLRNYGVPYATGFAFGLALQAIEIACGVALGLLSLMREGISFAMLRRLQQEDEVPAPAPDDAVEEVLEMVDELERESARVSR
jgi:glycosyltransferase 2 family protein